jgi:hypothetical protein
MMHKHISPRRACLFPEQAYSEKEDAVVVWFEAWRYQHEPSPVVALLHEIRGQLSRLVRATKWGKKILEVTLRSGLLQLEQIANFASIQSGGPALFPANRGGIAATIQEQGERYEREHLAEKLPAEAMREQLEHAFEQLLGRKKGDKVGEGRRVVVLIDDLDRCEPQATYRLLEGIKIYLNIPNCVFVLGMDQRIIEDAIAESAPGAKDKPDVARRRAREYLEKLFQEVYHLPIVQDVPTQLLAWLRDDFGKVPQSTRDDLKALLNEYPDCLPANPRKIKAFAAVLWRFLTEPDEKAIAAGHFTAIREHTETAARNPYLSLVVVMASLYHFHPRVYRILEAHPAEFYTKLWQWCANAGEGKDAFHDCLAGLERAFTVSSPAQAGSNTLPEMTSLLPDYSRGDVLRIQKLLYHARPFDKPQIQALLLK